MRKFVAACCCAIVGLEVLIAVPLVTCLVVLGLVGDVGGNQIAATVPPPQYAGVPTMLPPPVVPSLPSPVAYDKPAACPAPVGWTAPSICTVSPAPSSDTKYPVVPAEPPAPAPSPAPTAPQVAAIAELVDQVGSALASSSLVGDSKLTRDETIDALNRAAQEDATPTVVAKNDPELTCPGLCPHSSPAQSAESGTAQPSLIDALQAAAEALYVRAQALEIDGNFNRADELRGLARGIRGEIEALSQEVSNPVTTPVVKTAAYHEPIREPRPIEEPAKLEVERVAPAATLLVPAQAKLVEPAGNPQPLKVVSSEEELPEAQKVPENPGP